jgi:hypothetical protein
VKKRGRGRAIVAAKVESGATTDARVELRPLRTLAVEVVDAESGGPVAGASVAVTRLASGPNPGAFPDLNRHELFTAEPRTTDARGRLELRDLEAESMLQLVASAPHCAEWSGGLRHRGEDIDPFKPSPWQGVSADAGSIRIEMVRLVPRTLHWRIVPGPVAAPPDGTGLTIRYFDEYAHRGRPDTRSDKGVVRGGMVEVGGEMPPGSSTAWNGEAGWAVAPDGTIADLSPARNEADGNGTASFSRGASLDVTVLDPAGRPRPDEVVSVSLELPDDGRSPPPNDWSLTDQNGVARFTSLRAGRWIVAADGAARAVALTGEPTAVVLKARPLAEIVVEFTVDGVRRLPAELPLWVDGEQVARRREDPGRGDLHLFVTPMKSDREAKLRFTSEKWGSAVRPLPPLEEGKAVVVPFALESSGCDAIVHLTGLHPSRPSLQPSFQRTVVLERLDEASGRFDDFEMRFTLFVQPFQDTLEQRFIALRPGTWRVAFRETGTFGEPFRVVAGGPTATFDFDVSSTGAVSVDWKIPDGENAEFLELERPGPHPSDRWWSSWESEWPLTPSQQYFQPFIFDRNHLPPLRVHHPYLVPSKWNDSIDLTKPRSTITLHMELGPLVAFTPEFPVDLPFLHGAFVTLAGGRDPAKPPELRRALRRGDAFVMAPPAAGERRVLIDPVVAAPVELDAVAFDGGALDLGPIRFTQGSTLHVHARASAPFVAPRVIAHATRIDGIAYDRASSLLQSVSEPTEPEIHALGPGLFRVTLGGEPGVDNSEWSAEVRVDGVHDAEVEVVTD